MAFRNIALDSPLQFPQAMSFGGSIREQSAMNVLRGISPRPTHHNLLAIVVPFEDGTRADSQAPAHLRRYRDLSLRRQL